jgi:hypothetical protein
LPASLQLALATVGTLSGLAYAGLGVAASKHLAQCSAPDRAVGWSLWWFVESSRYAAQGQVLCLRGAVAFVVCAVSWVAWFFVSKS